MALNFPGVLLGTAPRLLMIMPEHWPGLNGPSIWPATTGPATTSLRVQGDKFQFPSQNGCRAAYTRKHKSNVKQTQKQCKANTKGTHTHKYACTHTHMHTCKHKFMHSQIDSIPTFIHNTTHCTQVFQHHHRMLVSRWVVPGGGSAFRSGVEPNPKPILHALQQRSHPLPVWVLGQSLLPSHGSKRS